MNTPAPQVLDKIKTLFETEKLAVLATQKDHQPYASLLAFAADEALEHLFFLTPAATRKYDNLMASPQVALLINNSRNQASDIHNAVSVTATGTATEISGSEREQHLARYLKRHPHLKAFATDPATAMFKVFVDQYIMVSRFQDVAEIKMHRS
jgi:nitroimidazol reductase NimA-like FMN-containing flavoprotein (pyridoxamine 5'-phosphate oxidase superfamily)